MTPPYRYTAWTLLYGDKAMLNFHSIAGIIDWASANGLNFNPSMLGKYENTYAAERCDGKPLNKTERARLQNQAFRNENTFTQKRFRAVAAVIQELKP